MLSTTFLLAASLVVGQAESVSPMPAELQKQIDEHLIGEWTWEATWGDKKLTGEVSTRWTDDKTAVLMQGHSIVDGKKTIDVTLSGWDGVRKTFVGHGFTSDGDTGTSCWTSFSESKWTGRGSGTYMGKPWESAISLDLMKDKTRYEDVTHGKPFVAVYSRKPETEQAVIRLVPSNTAALIARAELYRQKGDLEKALAEYDEAVRLAPNIAWPYIRRANVHKDCRDFNKAIADYEKGVALLEQQATEPTTGPGVSATLNSEYSNLGTLLSDVGRLEEAEKAFRSAVGIAERLTDDFPQEEYFWYQHVDSYGRLIRLLRLTDRIQEADHLLHGMKNPPTANALSRRAGMFGELREVDRALADFSKAIELEPKNVATWTAHARFQAERGQWEKAIADFDIALQLQPASAEDCRNLAWALATSTDSRVWKPDRAVELAAKATQLAPRNWMNWSTLGVAQYRAGQFKDAIDTLAKSMELRSDRAASDWFFLAMAHWQLRNKEEARRWYDKAVEWAEKNKRDDKEILRFRTEAAELLGICSKPPAEKREL